MKLKKFTAIAAGLFTIISLSFPVYAADLNDSEKSIITTLESCSVPSSYVTQARNYFLQDSVDVTSEQASTINTQISAAKVHAGNASDLSSLSADQQTQIVQDLAIAGNAIGLSVTYNAASKTITVMNGSTKVFEAVGGNITTSISTGAASSTTGNNSNGTSTGTTSTGNGIIKQTGLNFNTSIMILISIALGACLCGTVVYTKKISQKEV